MNINKFDDLVNKCKNTFHRTIKMKPIYIKLSIYIKFDIENNDKDSKIVIGWEYQNIKLFLHPKRCIQIDLKKFLFLKT